MPTFRTTAYITSREATLGETIAKAGRRFFIPLNQRPFVWSKQQITKFFTDFETQLTSHYDAVTPDGTWKEKNQIDSMPHFLGNFIFVERPGSGNSFPDEVEVYDGQQRLTAIAMLASCLLDQATEMLVKAPGAPSSLAHTALMKWLFADLRPTNPSPRIVPDPAFNSLFDALIVSNRTEAARRIAINALGLNFATNPDHKTLHERFWDLHTQVSSRLAAMPEPERVAYLTASGEILSRFFLCTETIVPIEAFGLRVFASLNTAATPLSAADNLKNEFFIRLPKNDHGIVSNEWRRMINALAAIPPKDFLRRRMLSYGVQCRNDDKNIFETYKSSELNGKTNSQLIQLLAALSAEAETLRNIRHPNGFNAPTTRCLHEIYKILTASIADIVVLACHRILLPNDASGFQHAVQAIRNFLFRELTIGQRDTSDIEVRLTNAARRIHADGLPGLIDELNQSSEDDNFQRKFSEKVEERSLVQFYILDAIEEYLNKSQGLRPYPQSPKQHIEHIVPKNVEKRLPNGNAAWPHWTGRRRSLHERYVNRLGNLLLLEADINSSVKNRSFVEKKSGLRFLKNKTIQKKGYCNSQFRLAKRLSKFSLLEFTRDHIDRRQRFLARLALRVWRIK